MARSGNQALDELRRQHARPCAGWEERDALEHLPLHWRPNTGREVEQRWLYQHVAWALGQIPVQQRQCLELIYFDGLSQREIAERTHTPLGTIKTQVRCGLAERAGKVIVREGKGTSACLEARRL